MPALGILHAIELVAALRAVPPHLDVAPQPAMRTADEPIRAGVFVPPRREMAKNVEKSHFRTPFRRAWP